MPQQLWLHHNYTSLCVTWRQTEAESLPRAPPTWAVTHRHSTLQQHGAGRAAQTLRGWTKSAGHEVNMDDGGNGLDLAGHRSVTRIVPAGEDFMTPRMKLSWLWSQPYRDSVTGTSQVQLAGKLSSLCNVHRSYMDRLDSHFTDLANDIKLS